MGKKFGMSFSWNRALGVSSAKARFARATGIPTTRQGRQRKAGAAMGCMIPIVCAIGMFFICSCGKQKEPDFGLMQRNVIEARLKYKDKSADYTVKIQEVKQKISDAKENFKDDPETMKSFVDTFEKLLSTYQAMDQANKKILAETPEQTRKAAFVWLHVQYAALQDSTSKKDFMKIINDPEIFSGQGVKSILIMKYPAYTKESTTKEYAKRVDSLLRDLKLKSAMGILTYDNVSDLESAYETLKKLY